nr:uncharacterized protein LOC104115459 isoform X1 [Nicotiana tomentosiformis]
MHDCLLCNCQLKHFSSLKALGILDFQKMPHLKKNLQSLPSNCAGCLTNKPSKSSTQPADDKSSRIRLRDGRYLAYRETGVAKNMSSYKVIVAHGLNDSKEINYPECQVRTEGVFGMELKNEIGIYLVQYDRPGYGESDPNPDRSSKNEASDIEELVDQLELGPKFYIIAISAGCYSGWSCLKHIPQRLAGVALVVSPINYTWPSLPKDMIKDDPRRNMIGKLVWLGKNAPGLLYCIHILSSSLKRRGNAQETNKNLTNHDVEILKNRQQKLAGQERMRRRDFNTVVRDLVVVSGKWDFDPLELSNTFSQDDSCVHIWQGNEDPLVPFQIQRYVTKKLQWIKYHEVPYGGHHLLYDKKLWEAILRSLLLGDGSNQYEPKLDD